MLVSSKAEWDTWVLLSVERVALAGALLEPREVHRWVRAASGSCASGWWEEADRQMLTACKWSQKREALELFGRGCLPQQSPRSAIDFNVTEADFSRMAVSV